MQYIKRAFLLTIRRKIVESYWKTYVMFGKLALLQEQNLRLLSVVDSVDRLELLPSWCPNLNSISSTEIDRDNVFTAKPFASDVLAWLHSRKNFCSDAMSGHETSEFVWQEIMVATRNDPAKRAEAADMSPYNLMQTVLDLITRSREDNSRRKDIPDLYELFEAVYTW
jgi:hypothetical protein